MNSIDRRFTIAPMVDWSKYPINAKKSNADEIQN
jgi:hypothetical protein